jgi:hypothetical protein
LRGSEGGGEGLGSEKRVGARSSTPSSVPHLGNLREVVEPAQKVPLSSLVELEPVARDLLVVLHRNEAGREERGWWRRSETTLQ